MVSPLALRSVSAWALPRPSAMASAKLAKRDGKPEPEGDLEIETEAGAMVNGVVDQDGGGQDGAHLDDEHDGVFDHAAGIELAHRIEERPGP